MLVGGRVTTEDAYAYGKFARVALATNDVDFRARPHSAEEADFLAATSWPPAPGRAVTYADLERAATVLLVGFEPEEESPIVFLRLRKAVRKHRTAVYAVAPFATRGLDQAAAARSSRPRPAPRPRCCARSPTASRGDGRCAAAAEALRAERALVLVGERLADGARRAVRGRGPGRRHRRPPRLGAPPRR